LGRLKMIPLCLPGTLLSVDENSRIQFSILKAKLDIWNTSAPIKCFSKSRDIQIQVPSAVLKVLEHWNALQEEFDVQLDLGH
jgi:hypothetical protein